MIVFCRKYIKNYFFSCRFQYFFVPLHSLINVSVQMKRLFFFLALAALGCMPLSAKQYAYRTVEGDPLKARIYTLDNGLTVYLTQNKEKPEILTYIVVRAGAQNDPLESTGLAHYQEHIMFKGTERYGTTDYEAERPNLLAIDSLYELYGATTDPERRKAIYHLIDSFSYESSKIAIANEFDKLMSGIGATGVNAYTAEAMTCYHEVIPATELARWAIIESDRFQNLVIRGFHTELEAVYEEFNMYSAMDREKVILAIDQTLYPAIPYRQHTVLGTQEHLKNPSIRNIRAFYDTYYRPNNVAICLSGDFEFDEAMDIIDTYFGDWQPKQSPEPIRYTQPDLKSHKDTIVYGNEAPELWMAWKMPPVTDADMPALEVMNLVLQNGKCGLIDVDLEQKQALLSAFGALQTNGDYSTFYLVGSPKEKQKLEDVRTILLAEIDKLKRGEFSENLLKAIIRNEKRQKLLEQQYNEGRIGSFITAHVYGIPYEEIVRDIALKEAVTKDEVVRVANKYFTDSYACVIKQCAPGSNPPKMDKPAITPIEMNREKSSLFYQSLMAVETERPRPQFLDFDKDLSRSVLPNGVELLYCRNKENDLTDLSFVAHKGTDQEPKIEWACNLLNYLGTASLSTAEYQQALYAQAAEVSVGAGLNDTYFYIHGLNESMSEALRLMEDHVLTAQPDKAVLKEIIRDEKKGHADAKKDQQACMGQISEYGLYGADVVRHRTFTPKQMKKLSAEDLLATLRTVVPAIERVEYYGPLSEDEVKALLASSQFLAKADASMRKPAQRVSIQKTPKTEILVAPYKANNVFISAVANWGETYDPKQLAVAFLFNEYFAGSMGGIVFQEMRESRALCYAAWAGYRLASYKGDPNYINKGVLTQNDKLKDCILTLTDICDNMPVSQAAFENAKASAMLQLGQTRYVRSQPINAYIEYTQRGWNHDYYKDVYDQLPNLTINDIVAFQKEHVANKTYRYMILGNPKELDMKYLKSLGTVKKLSLKDIFVY